jgi:hypothetical protein
VSLSWSTAAAASTATVAAAQLTVSAALRDAAGDATAAAAGGGIAPHEEASRRLQRIVRATRGSADAATRLLATFHALMQASGSQLPASPACAAVALSLWAVVAVEAAALDADERLFRTEPAALAADSTAVCTLLLWPLALPTDVTGQVRALTAMRKLRIGLIGKCDRKCPLHDGQRPNFRPNYRGVSSGPKLDSPELRSSGELGLSCTTPPLKMVTRFATSPPTDNCPRPKEAQPLSQLDIRIYYNILTHSRLCGLMQSGGGVCLAGGVGAVGGRGGVERAVSLAAAPGGTTRGCCTRRPTHHAGSAHAARAARAGRPPGR